ncbi:MAG: hypothetical protein KDB65_00270 [Calditrichaeota bacterium]|nr:hypothetical protein [Calditrichota bacterium]MCB9368538.1 hypothetical protein [Calditrichota bacterium]
MSSRISLYLESLSLDDLLFLETELNKRKSKFNADHVVLAVQTEQKVLATLRRDTINQFARDMRKFINECSVAGGGVLLAYTPDVSLLLFKDVPSAAKTASLLLTGLAEMNGKHGSSEHRIALKLGLSSGHDTLAAGSMRSVRQSVLVRRASQCAWKAPSGTMLMDENCARAWERKNEPVRIPIEIEGVSVYRVTPTVSIPAQKVADEDKFTEFLDHIVQKNITTLKYSLLREEAEESSNGAWSKPVARAVITIEAFDSEIMRNISYTLKCSLGDYSNLIDRIRRMISDRGLGLVKHEEASSISM